MIEKLETLIYYQKELKKLAINREEGVLSVEFIMVENIIWEAKKETLQEVEKLIEKEIIERRNNLLKEIYNDPEFQAMVAETFELDNHKNKIIYVPGNELNTVRWAEDSK